MTDRELLELAAKAAGLTILRKLQEERDGQGFGDVGLYIKAVSTGWNPLTDDGHALQLATKLRIDIEWQEYGGVEAYRRIGVECNGPHFCAYEQSQRGEDPCAAIRRSIVRAAAEIGKAQP